MHNPDMSILTPRNDSDRSKEIPIIWIHPRKNIFTQALN